MATAKHTAPDFSAILGRFFEARSVIEITCRSLERADDGPTEEACSLRTGLRMLNAAYDELDTAIMTLPEPRNVEEA